MAKDSWGTGWKGCMMEMLERFGGAVPYCMWVEISQADGTYHFMVFLCVLKKTWQGCTS